MSNVVNERVCDGTFNSKVLKVSLSTNDYTSTLNGEKLSRVSGPSLLRCIDVDILPVFPV